MMKMIKVCIPSYGRPKVKTLERYPDCTLFVCESEEKRYRELNPGADMVIVDDAVQGNVARVRNYILDYIFKSGKADAVVLLDDDMDYIGVFRDRAPRNGWDVEKLDQEQLYQLIADVVQLSEDFNVKMFGLNCAGTAPKSYARSKPFSLTQFCGGPFQGFLKNDLRYDENLPLKEDYDMCLQQALNYGGLLRLNYAFTMSAQGCKGTSQEGGCSTYRNIREEKREFDKLRKRWGSDVVRYDRGSKRQFDYNPRIRIPIKGA